MRRSLLLPLLLTALGAVACSDRTQPTAPGLAAPSGTFHTSTPGTTLAAEIPARIQFDWPKGLETAAGTRWDGIVAKLNISTRVNADGSITITDAAQYSVAQSKFRELADWVQKKAPDMELAIGTAEKNAEAAKLVLLMSMYVARGPSFPAPSLGSDVSVFTIPANNPRTTITSPLHKAGVTFAANTFSEPTIVSIGNVVPDASTPQCAGPLPTTVCQYRLFYRIEAFPLKRLQVSANFAVCHVNSGAFAPPEHIHDRLRLAHETPIDPANRTPGSRYVDGIEILPRVQVPLDLRAALNCAAPTTASLDRVRFENPLVQRAWLNVASAINAVGRFITPKEAQAIDAGGGGGLGDFFSYFGNVDAAPDLEALSVTAEPVDPAAGTTRAFTTRQLRIGYSLRNRGIIASVPSGGIEFHTDDPDADFEPESYDGPPVTVRFYLVPTGTFDGPPPPPIALAPDLQLLPLNPGATRAADVATGHVVTIPAGVPTANYKIRMVVDPTDLPIDDQVRDELQEGNNQVDSDFGNVGTQQVLSVAVAPTTNTLDIGGTTQLTPTVNVNGFLSTAVTWSSSDATVATVSGTGFVTALAPGSTRIRATSVADPTKYAEATITVFPNVSGQVTDNVGDAASPGTNDAPPDLVSTSIVSSNGILNIVIRFAPGALGANTRAQISFDTDQNPATGHPGVDAGGVRDGTILGSEFILNVASAANGGGATLFEYTGPPINTFSQRASFTTTIVGDEIHIALPRAALGNDDGVLNFKVTSSISTGANTSTGVLDIMTDVGLPVGSTAPIAPIG